MLESVKNKKTNWLIAKGEISEFEFQYLYEHRVFIMHFRVSGFLVFKVL
jgi:hypothetical protein